MKTRSIYICHTVYHLLIAIVKEIQLDRKVDLVLCDTIPNSNELLETMIHFEVFDQVYYFSETKYSKDDFQKSKYLGKIGFLFSSQKIKRIIKPNFPINDAIYSEINIFNDKTYFGMFLRVHHLYYNLLEDGKDCFKLITHNFIQPKYRNWKQILFKFAYDPFESMGASKYSRIIEVNDSEGLKFPASKLRVYRKQELFALLNESSKLAIYRLFIGEKKLPNIQQIDTVLILTQPFFDYGMVKSRDVQEAIYRDIINTYCIGRRIVIKAHPRDNFPYSDVFQNIIELDQSIPIEVLNFNSEMHFRLAITVTSTSISDLSFVDEKVYLGQNWLSRYIQ